VTPKTIEKMCETHMADTIRKQRRKLGISQHMLAQRVGVSFQQIQKYERGTNRISASRLFVIAEILSINIADLYPIHASVPALLPIESDFMKVLDTINKIDNKTVKNSILDLAKALVKKEDNHAPIPTELHARHRPIYPG
jgi:transcriptional regulator with XRE-family HTH domain